MTDRILKDWHFARILRLVLAIIIIISSISTRDYLFIVLGIILSIMAVLNIGSCSSGSCNYGSCSLKQNK